MELLKRLYKIHSPSKRERNLVKFITKWVNENVPEAVLERDNKSGNVYITKGVDATYPVVVAHLDQVQNSHSRDFKALEAGDVIMGYSAKSRMQQGLGADDKNGIWVALKCLQRFDVIKVALFVSEEIGCIGSSQARMSFFDDARFVLQCDRRGAHDLITCAGWTQLCSEEFVQAINPAAFGYKEEDGMMTDVLELKENGLKVSCVNMSCGYYNPHTDEEITVKSDLLNCLRFVEHIIGNCLAVYPHEETYDYSRYSKYYSKYDARDFYTDDTDVENLQEVDVDFDLDNGYEDKYWDDAAEWLSQYPECSLEGLRWYLEMKYPTAKIDDNWLERIYNDTRYWLHEQGLGTINYDEQEVN